MNAKLTGTPTEVSSQQPAAIADIIGELKRLLVEDLDARITAEMVTDDVRLLESGLGLDSIVLYEFITLIEKRFGFEFADQDLGTEIFENLTILAQHIHTRTAQRLRAAAS
ncbi:MAG TPA: phosphopantetheine-binding protein [Kofleriaceae bacterium]|jgi:acyl carrier protein|nr:phosphopantetheine-binding protein [Kofleriaceae bacterium]